MAEFCSGWTNLHTCYILRAMTMPWRHHETLYILLHCHFLFSSLSNSQENDKRLLQSQPDLVRTPCTSMLQDPLANCLIVTTRATAPILLLSPAATATMTDRASSEPRPAVNVTCNNCDQQLRPTTACRLVTSHEPSEPRLSLSSNRCGSILRHWILRNRD
jgi:hypothetical protein